LFELPSSNLQFAIVILQFAFLFGHRSSLTSGLRAKPAPPITFSQWTVLESNQVLPGFNRTLSPDQLTVLKQKGPGVTQDTWPFEAHGNDHVSQAQTKTRA
jgi:hypothetical protein